MAIVLNTSLELVTSFRLNKSLPLGLISFPATHYLFIDSVLINYSLAELMVQSLGNIQMFGGGEWLGHIQMFW